VKTREFLDAVCDALRREPGSLGLEDTPSTVVEWDSVGHLAILATVDSKLSIPIDESDVQQFGSLRELVEKLRSKGVVLDD